MFSDYSKRMDDFELFNIWLTKNTSFACRTKSNIKSRIKRANLILPFEQSETYIFLLSNEMKKKGISASVRSQIKKSVTLYMQFLNEAIK